MAEVGNEGRDGAFGHNRISMGGQGQLKERTEADKAEAIVAR
jgi:hypothetical protein